MRPEGVESNHFAYHLDQLLRAGLVTKQEKQYALGLDGLRAVDRMSQAKMIDREQPHIVTAIDITAANGQTLLYKRRFQPYINRIGFPLGKTHYNETIAEAATRELHEKTGLTAIPLTHRGDVYVDAKQGGQTISKILCHVFHGEVSEPLDIVPPSARGECLWANADKLASQDAMPGFHQIKQLLQQPQLFFAEFVVEL
jgi:8-oxo-dGTP pyrophosphatase MutT (NUDIX family)